MRIFEYRLDSASCAVPMVGCLPAGGVVFPCWADRFPQLGGSDARSTLHFPKGAKVSFDKSVGSCGAGRGGSVLPQNDDYECVECQNGQGKPILNNLDKKCIPSNSTLENTLRCLKRECEHYKTVSPGSQFLRTLDDMEI